MAEGRTDAETLSPAESERVREAVHQSAAAEVATARDGRPRTFPLSPFYDHGSETVIVTSPPAFAGKIEALRENPRLTLFFYGSEEPFSLRGRATVHDSDLESNAERVRELAESEPPSAKREGFSKTVSLLESRVGRFLFGWYALRIVVEVTPVSIEPADGSSGPLPPWPERGVDADEARAYDRLAFTVVDEDGWPRTRSVADVELRDAEALLDVPTSVTEGQPACLLCHWHTPGLKHLGQRLFRGRCRPAGDRVAFESASSVSMHNETVLDTLRFIVQGKRRTRAYFRG